MHLNPKKAKNIRLEAAETLRYRTNGVGGPALRPLGKGFNSVAYQDGVHAYKVSRSIYDEAAAARTIERARSHYDLLRGYSGALISETEFVAIRLASLQGGILMGTVQPLAEGKPISSGVPYSREALLVLFKTQLKMYRVKGTIGDLAAIEGLFSPFRTSNIIIGPDGYPTLADVDMGKTQASELLGAAWNGFIARGVEKGIARLRKH